jgi:hypothetical protein
MLFFHIRVRSLEGEGGLFSSPCSDYNFLHFWYRLIEIDEAFSGKKLNNEKAELGQKLTANNTYTGTTYRINFEN